MLSFMRKKAKKEIEIKAYISGNVIPIGKVEDEVFSSKALGDGIAIEPVENTVYAPCDGVISVISEETMHAVGMTLANGAEILIHEGIDTVNLKGEGFSLFVNVGDKVKAGEKLLSFDDQLLREKGFKNTSILVLTNSGEFPDARFITGIDAIHNETTVLTFE